MTRGPVGAMVTLEALLMAAVALVLGSGLGAFFAWGGVSSLVAHDGVTMVLSVPWDRMGLIWGVTLLAGVLASFLPARALSRTPPAAGLTAQQGTQNPQVGLMVTDQQPRLGGPALERRSIAPRAHAALAHEASAARIASERVRCSRSARAITAASSDWLRRTVTACDGSLVREGRPGERNFAPGKPSSAFLTRPAITSSVISTPSISP